MKKIVSNLLHYYIFFNNFESIEFNKFNKQIDVILNSIRSFFLKYFIYFLASRIQYKHRWFW